MNIGIRKLIPTKDVSYSLKVFKNEDFPLGLSLCDKFIWKLCTVDNTLVFKRIF